MVNYLIMIRIALFDLETTGFPRKLAHSTLKFVNLDSFNSARVIQIGMMIYELNPVDESYKLIKTYDKTIKPDGFRINNSHIHNITQQMAETEGVPFSEAIYEMMEDLCNIDILIAHNVQFDRPIFLSELYRYEFGEILQKLNTARTFCTMAQCATITKIKNKTSYKRPKLSELHDYLFKTTTETAHNALADTRVLAKCFWQLYDLDLIKISIEGVELNKDSASA
jgi:DNA polymerase III epsilon subunit-like protein